MEAVVVAAHSDAEVAHARWLSAHANYLSLMHAVCAPVCCRSEMRAAGSENDKPSSNTAAQATNFELRMLICFRLSIILQFRLWRR